MATTRANENRKIRQEALRDQLANKGLMQQVIEISEKLNNLDIELSPTEVQRLNSAATLKLKLVDKYLPGMKLVEMEGEIDSSLTITIANFKDIEDGRAGN